MTIEDAAQGTPSTQRSDDELVALGNGTLLLGTLFLESPKDDAVAASIAGLGALDLADEWPWGNTEDLEAVTDLLAEAQQTDPAALDRAFHHLFVGPNALAAPPWGSVYQDAEAVTFGDSCVALTRWMAAHGIALHEVTSREPADHIGRMLVLLSWLCEHEPALVDEYLRDHLMNWTPRYLERLATAAQNEGCAFYEGLARLTAITLEGAAR